MKAYLSLTDNGSFVATLETGDRIESENIDSLVERLWRFDVKESGILVADSNGGTDNAKLADQIIVIKQALRIFEVNHGFIHDELAEQKNKNRQEFSQQIKDGLAKATDASVFHGLACNIKVKYRDEEF